MGVLAIFSVGLLLLIAGILMVVWLIRTSPERQGSGAIPSIAGFLAGVVLPWSLLVIR
jgi:hypothetical protein